MSRPRRSALVIVIQDTDMDHQDRGFSATVIAHYALGWRLDNSTVVGNRIWLVFERTVSQ